jgi:hypothetical protein
VLAAMSIPIHATGHEEEPDERSCDDCSREWCQLGDNGIDPIDNGVHCPAWEPNKTRGDDNGK